MECHRSGVVCDVRRAGAIRPHHRHPRAAAGRYRFGDRRRAGRVGRAGCLLQPAALRRGRLHRFFAVRRRRHGARSGVRGARAGRGRYPAPRALAGAPEKPGRLSDLSLPGRLRAVMCDGAAAVARTATLAGGAGRLPGPEVRRDRRTIRGVVRDRRADPGVVRRADDEGLGDRRTAARGADRRGADAVANPGLGAFPGGGRHYRGGAGPPCADHRAHRIFRRRRAAVRLSVAGARGGK